MGSAVKYKAAGCCVKVIQLSHHSGEPAKPGERTV